MRGGPVGEDVQKQALNGTQITSMVEIVRMAAAGEISRESAQAALEVSFQLTPEDAIKLLGPEDFEPVKPEPEFGFGGGGGFGGNGGPPGADKGGKAFGKAGGASADAPGAGKGDAAPPPFVAKGEDESK